MRRKLETSTEQLVCAQQSTQVGTRRGASNSPPNLVTSWKVLKSTLRLLPPLILTIEEASEAIERLEQACEAARAAAS